MQDYYIIIQIHLIKIITH